MSVHPGTVDTEAQKAWTESYGSIFGTILEKGSQLFGKTAAEGAEAVLWGATSRDIFEGNWKDFQASMQQFVKLSHPLTSLVGQLLFGAVWECRY